MFDCFNGGDKQKLLEPPKSASPNKLDTSPNNSPFRAS